MRLENAVVFTIPGAADEALTNIFDAYPRWFETTMVRRGKGYSLRVLALVEGARLLLEEAELRAESPRGEGWDQSPGWRLACRKAALAIREALDIWESER